MAKTTTIVPKKKRIRVKKTNVQNTIDKIQDWSQLASLIAGIISKQLAENTANVAEAQSNLKQAPESMGPNILDDKSYPATPASLPNPVPHRVRWQNVEMVKGYRVVIRLQDTVQVTHYAPTMTLILQYINSMEQFGITDVNTQSYEYPECIGGWYPY